MFVSRLDREKMERKPKFRKKKPRLVTVFTFESLSKSVSCSVALDIISKRSDPPEVNTIQTGEDAVRVEVFESALNTEGPAVDVAYICWASCLLSSGLIRTFTSGFKESIRTQWAPVNRFVRIAILIQLWKKNLCRVSVIELSSQTFFFGTDYLLQRFFVPCITFVLVSFVWSWSSFFV